MRNVITAAGSSSRLIGMLAAIVVLFGAFSLVEPAMASATNLANLLNQTSLLFILAAAQLLVLIARGFDLSVGANVSLVSVASSMVMVKIGSADPGMAVTSGVLMTLAIGCAIGALNGFLVSYLAINPFVVTLGVMSVAAGLATTISDGFPIFDVPTAFSYAFNQARWLLLPAPVAVAVLLALVIHFVLTRTLHGRSLYLIGDNAQAGVVAGRNVKLHLFLAYMSCGVIAALGGMMITAQTGSGEPNLGTSLVLNSIAAAVVGGASLRGGVGDIGAPLCGAALITVLSVGMNLTQVDGSLQQVIIGLVVVGAAVSGPLIRGLSAGLRT